MKNTTVFTIVLLFVISFATSNCTADHNFIPSTEEILTRNGWEVDYYFQQHDMTGEFSEYRITFRTSGTIYCRTGNEVNSGSWNLVMDPSQPEIININLNTTNPCVNKLSGSWILVNKYSSTMNFENGQPPSASIMHIRIKP